MKAERKLYLTPEGRALRRRAATALHDLWSKYSHEISLPKLKYFDHPMMMAAAQVCTNTIGLNARAVFDCTDHILTEGIAHEFAHLLCAVRHPETRTAHDYHGAKWTIIMAELGYPNAKAKYEGPCAIYSPEETLRHYLSELLRRL